MLKDQYESFQLGYILQVPQNNNNNNRDFNNALQ